MGVVILVIVVFVAGSIISGLVRGGIDSSYDSAVKEKLANIKSRALNRLGLDIDEVNEVPPAIFHGYDLSKVQRRLRRMDWQR